LNHHFQRDVVSSFVENALEESLEGGISCGRVWPAPTLMCSISTNPVRVAATGSAACSGADFPVAGSAVLLSVRQEFWKNRQRFLYGHEAILISAKQTVRRYHSFVMTGAGS